MNDIHLYGTVGNDFWGDCFGASEVKDQLDQCEGDVTVHVNSGGGDAFEGVTISQLFAAYRKATGAKVICRVEGLAASAASYMVLTADEVVMTPGSMMMIHNPSTICEGNAQDFRRAADTLDSLADSISSQYQLKTGKTADEIRAAMDAETWFTADEAVGFGLADSVDTGALAVAAMVDPHFAHLYQKMPACVAVENEAHGHTPSKKEATDALPAAGEAPDESQPREGPELRCVLGHVFYEKKEH